MYGHSRFSDQKNAIVGVCHVLRYAPYFIALKQIIDSGDIGQLISIQHLEPIQYAHMAHSYVRGNWHNSKETTPIIWQNPATTSTLSDGWSALHANPFRPTAL